MLADESFVALIMIIICPNCDTRYQVAQNAIGAAGRKVQCANCSESWQAMAEEEKPKPKPKLVEKPTPPEVEEPEDDRLFDEADEAALDEAFANVEEKNAPAKAADTADDDASEADAAPEVGKKAKPAAKGPVKSSFDAALNKQRQMAMHIRQMKFAKNLPMGRIRGNARLVGLCLLACVIFGGSYFRTDVVRMFPDLAGIYAAIGMKVNVVGLEFRDVETLRALKNGSDVMVVSGRIQNITGRRVNVPAVVVSILDEAGSSLYSWSVTPAAQSIGPREIVEFETQLNAAPQGAYTVKLGFADGRAN